MLHQPPAKPAFSSSPRPSLSRKTQSTKPSTGSPKNTARSSAWPMVIVFILVRCAVQECFTKNDVVSANRPSLLLSKHLGYNNTIVTTCPHGDHWRNLRRIGAIEIFPSARPNAFADVRKDKVKYLIRKLSQNSIHGFAKVELKFVL